MCSVSDGLNGRVLRPHALVLALLLSCAGVVLTQGPAHACKCASASVRAEVKQADAVFSGVLVESSDGASGRRGGTDTTYRIEAQTLYKGDLPRATVEVTSPGTSCGLSLRVDRRYFFFVTERGAELTTNQCSGTARAKGQLVHKIEQVAGEGKDVGPSDPAEPVEPTFTPVDDGEPEELTRLAAPGVALALVGLLGLLVVRRRGGA